MFPLFIIIILIIFPSYTLTMQHSKLDFSILKSNDNSNALTSIKNIRIIDADLNLPENAPLGKDGKDKSSSAESLRSQSSYLQSQLSQGLLKTQLKLLKNFQFMVSSNGIKQYVRIDSKRKDDLDGFIYEGQKALIIQSKKSFQWPAARVQQITRNQKKLLKNLINQQKIQTNLSAQDDNTQQDDDFLQFNQERTLQSGSLGGNSNEGVLNNTGLSVSPIESTTNTTNTTTSPPETTSPTAPIQENYTSYKPPIAPQTPTNSSSTSKSNTDSSSVIIIVFAITVPIAIIAIIIITCKFLKTPPQPGQGDCKGTISQTNLRTTVDSSAAETNEGMHRVQENVDSRAQSIAS